METSYPGARMTFEEIETLAQKVLDGIVEVIDLAPGEEVGSR